MTDTLHEADRYTVFMTSCSILLRMETFHTKVAENVKTHILFFENRAVYEIMWKNFEESDRPQMTI